MDHREQSLPRPLQEKQTHRQPQIFLAVAYLTYLNLKIVSTSLLKTIVSQLCNNIGFANFAVSVIHLVLFFSPIII